MTEASTESRGRAGAPARAAVTAGVVLARFARR